jgi:uncharacterized protein YgbK (DUF1537 family)
MKSWRLLADDLTGALDSAAAFAGPQAVPVFLAHPDLDATAAVQAVCSASRDAAPDRLPALLQPSLDWLAGDGTSFAFKKIDSLLRGNTFREIAWLLRAGGFDGAVFAPAFPAQGRFTEAGCHWVSSPHEPRSQRTHEHPQPLQDALAAVGLAAHSQGEPEGRAVLMPDIVGPGDLDRLASMLASPRSRRWLWCGSAGLAAALARRAGFASTSSSSPSIRHGSTLVVTASRHPVLRAQWPALRVRCDADARPAAHLQWLDLSDPQPLAAREALASLERQAHDLLDTVACPSTLIAIGGDTLWALSRAASVRAFHAVAGPRPGWGSARLVGGRWDGVICHSRSGAFGAPGDLVDLIDTLQGPTDMTPLADPLRAVRS